MTTSEQNYYSSQFPCHDNHEQHHNDVRIPPEYTIVTINMLLNIFQWNLIIAVLRRADSRHLAICTCFQGGPPFWNVF
jgi:hypothetical protein